MTFTMVTISTMSLMLTVAYIEFCFFVADLKVVMVMVMAPSEDTRNVYSHLLITEEVMCEQISVGYLSNAKKVFKVKLHSSSDDGLCGYGTHFSPILNMHVQLCQLH
jgi:hypothetical protein